MADCELSTEQINAEVKSLKQRLRQLEDEQKRRVIVAAVKQDGYFITEFDIEVAGLSKGRLSLPVECILDTRSKIHYGEYDSDSIKVGAYDVDKLPPWTQHLKYPEKPSDDFDVTTDWDVSDHDSPYEAKGYCVFDIYYQPLDLSTKPEKGICFDPDFEGLQYFELVDGKYTVYFNYSEEEIKRFKPQCPIVYKGITFYDGYTLEIEEFLTDPLCVIPL